MSSNSRNNSKDVILDAKASLSASFTIKTEIPKSKRDEIFRKSVLNELKDIKKDLEKAKKDGWIKMLIGVLLGAIPTLLVTLVL